MEKFSLTDIKRMNYSDVYHYIYEHDCCAKQSIANELKMSLPTVSQHLNALTEEGLIEKNGQLNSQIGRKAAAYTIRPQARIALGVEILQNSILIVAVDLKGELIDFLHADLTFETTDTYYQHVINRLLQFKESLNINDDQILGIGFGLQGLVSDDGTHILYGKILNCTGLSIDVFARHLPFPCQFIHDSECAALCDLWANPDLTNALYLSIGHHLGGALILDREISTGRTGRSGTFEHMTLIPNGKSCYCGRKGCMECYCSVQALLEDYPNKNLDMFFSALERKDPAASEKWNRFLDHLAAAINNLHMVIDCDIILGGLIAPYLKNEDFQELHLLVQKRTAFPESEPFIRQGQRRKNAVAIGAALPYINKFLGDI